MDKSYWEARWTTKQTGWDIGYASPAIISLVTTTVEKDECILIPGAGNAYEAETLWQEGYKHIYVVDISPTAIQNFLARCPDFPPDQAICTDFFQLDFTADHIIEQTFFCAFDPSYRQAYVEKCHELLSDGGHLKGLLFSREFDREGPPFGGSPADYEILFRPYFQPIVWEPCQDSIPPRQGSELLIDLKKK